MSFSNKIQAFLITLSAGAAIIVLIMALHNSDSRINKANLEFIQSYGWQTEKSPEDISNITIPEEFDEIYNAYNSIEASSGFDITPYKGVKAVRYSYKVLNHSSSDTGLIRANVFVLKNKIAAADICSLEIGGFIQPINDKSGQLSY